MLESWAHKHSVFFTMCRAGSAEFNFHPYLTFILSSVAFHMHMPFFCNKRFQFPAVQLNERHVGTPTRGDDSLQTEATHKPLARLTAGWAAEQMDVVQWPRTDWYIQKWKHLDSGHHSGKWVVDRWHIPWLSDCRQDFRSALNRNKWDLNNDCMNNESSSIIFYPMILSRA